jgi:uncharacterized protein YdhG (YjbR/CyaY superfamily)
MGDPTTVDEYMATLAPDRREAMEQMRATIRAAAPDATEVITYKMPGFTSGGQNLVSYDAFGRHYSLFAGRAAVEALGDRVAPYLAGKSTIRFPADEPIPTGLVTEVVNVRLAAIAEQSRSTPGRSGR